MREMYLLLHIQANDDIGNLPDVITTELRKNPAITEVGVSHSFEITGLLGTTPTICSTSVGPQVCFPPAKRNFWATVWDTLLNILSARSNRRF